MAYLNQFVQDLSAHMLCGRVGQDQSSLGFQCLQLIHQLVIFPVCHDRAILLVIGYVGIVNFADQFAHTVMLITVLIRTHVLPPR